MKSDTRRNIRIPYTEEDSPKEKYEREAGRGESRNTIARLASEEGHHGRRAFFKNARNHRRKEFWIVSAVAMVVLLVVLLRNVLPEARVKTALVDLRRVSIATIAVWVLGLEGKHR
jgi:Flp pilus assembly protein TadB